MHSQWYLNKGIYSQYFCAILCERRTLFFVLSLRYTYVRIESTLQSFTRLRFSPFACFCCAIFWHLFPVLCHLLDFFSFGSHEPPLFSLPYHHIWLFRAKLLFQMVYLGPLKCDFKNPAASRKKVQLKPFF